MSTVSVALASIQTIGPTEKAQMLELAERVAGVGHWFISLESDSLFWSDEIYRIHGKDAATFVPEVNSALDFYHPEDAPGVRDALAKAIEDKQPFEFECRIVRDDGTVRWVHSRSMIQTNGRGKATAVFGIFQDVTDQRTLKAELEDINARYHLAIRSSNAGLCDWNLTDNTLYWSPRFREIVGLNDDDSSVSLARFADLVHPDDRDRVTRETQAHINEGVPFETEYRLRHQDGHYLWVRATAQATWHADGQPERIAGSIVDISERKLDEVMREQVYELLTDKNLTAEEHINRLLDIGLDYLGLDTAIVSRIVASDYTAEYVRDRSGVLAPGTRFALDETYCARTLMNKGVLAFDPFTNHAMRSMPCFQKFGHESYIGVATAIGGAPYGTLCFSSVSPRTQAFGPREQSFVAMLSQWIANEIGQKMAMEALRQQRQELDLIFNRAPARIWFKDDSNRILRLNQLAAESMGMQVADAEGADTYDLFPEMAAKYHRDDLAVINAGEPRLGIIEQYTPRDGENGWVRTDKVPFIDPASQERRLLVLATDITELMNTQAALERQTERLKRSNRDLDDFAYIASHDLRAPMRGIDHLAEWIEEDIGETANAETLNNLRMLRGRIKRMDRMLGDILSYSRAGKDNPASEVLDLEELLRDLPDWVDPDHQHEFVFGDYLPRIQVPATAFQQIIMNLVSNAIKHHDKDRGRIEIQCERVKSALNISIIDDGPGIPQQFHQRIFRMFETLKRRDEVEASGIGLAIVERLVRSINGAISVHSKDGQRGTRFMVTIPASVIVRETNNDSRDA